jgi:8-hydroxy-5-deazaflavin:NADPH oxidoreductase
MNIGIIGSGSVAQTPGDKVLVDISNPLDFSRGMPPTLAFCNTDSVGARIQAAHPRLKVVKTLNTVNVSVMIDSHELGEDTTIFVAGNDTAAKEWVRETMLMGWFGRRDVLDVGDITAARGLEMYMPLWLRLWGATGTGALNVKVVRAGNGTAR